MATRTTSGDQLNRMDFNSCSGMLHPILDKKKEIKMVCQVFQQRMRERVRVRG